MFRRFKISVFSLLLLTAFSAVCGAQFGSLLKGGGIAFLVSHFGGEINKAINSVTKTPNDSPDFSTKVVPVISVGDGKEAGAVQVMGPRDAVAKVQAVAQFETQFKPAGIRLRGLVPIDSKNIKEIHRIPGVGISGLLDVKI